MLTLFRRHTRACKKGYAPNDRKGDKCDCCISVEGQLGSEFVRRSTKTRSMTKARKMVVEAEERGSWNQAVPISITRTAEVCNDGRKTVAEAVAEFIAEVGDVKGKNLGPASVSKYRTLLGRLKQHCEQYGIVALADVNYATLIAFKGTWSTRGLATRNNIARLRAFFKHCVRMEWCQKNVATDVDMPGNDSVERLPLSESEMQAVLDAAEHLKIDVQQPITNYELVTFILVMRHTGMAISDAALLELREILGDEVRYYRNKTQRQRKKQLVVVPLPRFVLDRLEQLPVLDGRYYFCHGSEHLVSAVSAWHKRLQKVFAATGIAPAQSHRLRHTFATDLLKRGIRIELVSRYLGHASVKMTQEHYSHYLEDRIQAESDVLRELYRTG